MSRMEYAVFLLTVSLVVGVMSGSHGNVSPVDDHHGNEQVHSVNLSSFDALDPEEWEEVEAAIYIQKIFNKYGDNGHLTFEGFEHLLEGLGLGNLIISDHDIHDHKVKDVFKPLHKTHNHTRNAAVVNGSGSHSNHSENKHHHHNDHRGEDQKKHKNESESSRNHGDSQESNGFHGHQNVGRRGLRIVKRGLPPLPPNHEHDHDNIDEMCLSPQQILRIFRLRQNGSISSANFLHLCPAILYQLDHHACPALPQPCTQSDDEHFDIFHASDHHDGNLDHDHEHYDNETLAVPLKRSFFDIPGKVWGFAVLSISVISLVGLVCVAIVPLMKKGLYDHLIQFLVALAVGTLTGDALLHLIPHALVPEHSDESDDGDHGDDDSVHNEAVFKGCVVLGGIYLFFLAERIMGIMGDWRQKRHEKKKRQKKVEEVYQLEACGAINQDIGEKLSRHNDRYASQDFPGATRSNRASRLLTEEICEELMELREHEENDADAAMETSDQNSGNHGHSHGPPGSVSAIAWMVIMGDGLHNFSDGLAIGAAFASSISVGLSTSIAVFCHELPHELGDFAVLLKAGMSVKLALFYNVISSVLSVIGMVIGVAVGNLNSASTWIFSMTAGIFIYISLVDMLPEITVVDVRFQKKRCCHLVLQLLGISTGVGIMLVIALFESRIKVG